ncbi:MAG TPA: hypothetical protein VM940_13095 [Chthoniobacterales bacterium]|jgi:hypothetical protein|nr:hypothetical protein [Chthoniobacterales bacterium]
MEIPGSRIFGRILLGFIWALPVIGALYVVWRYCVPFPFWDQWDSPGGQLASYYRGTLGWAELFSQHNESRAFFPRLAYLAMTIASGAWDTRNQIAWTLLWACGGSLGLYMILRQTSPLSRAVPFAFAAINFLLFSPRQYQNFLDPLISEAFIPGVTLILALWMNLTGRSFRTKTLVNAGLAFFATYTFANGMLVWVLGFPLTSAGPPRVRDRRQILWTSVYLALAAIALGFYFASYRHPPLSPPFVSPLTRLPELFSFLLVWIGSVFSLGPPDVLGGFILILFTGLVIAAVVQARRKTAEWRRYYPWLVLGCYALISGCVVALGRLGFGASMAGDARYTASSVFLYIAVAGLGFTLLARTDERRRAPAITWLAVTGSVLLLILCWVVTFQKERRIWRRLARWSGHLSLVVRWSEAIPQNPDLVFLSPYPLPETARTIRTLSERDILRPRLVGPALASAVREIPAEQSPNAGRLEEVKGDTHSRLFCRGWAWIPEQNRAADCVVLGWEKSDGRLDPLYVVETGGKRSDLVPQIGAAHSSAGFSATLDARTLPENATIRAWAIDLKTEQAFPMDGAVKLPLHR